VSLHVLSVLASSFSLLDMHRINSTEVSFIDKASTMMPPSQMQMGQPLVSLPTIQSLAGSQYAGAMCSVMRSSIVRASALTHTQQILFTCTHTRTNIGGALPVKGGRGRLLSTWRWWRRYRVRVCVCVCVCVCMHACMRLRSRDRVI
jgi:hypothetical protein